MRTELTIAGMTCSHCVQTIDRVLRTCSGVSEVIVSLSDGIAEVEHDPEGVSPERLVNLVEDEGYEASVSTR